MLALETVAVLVLGAGAVAVSWLHVLSRQGADAARINWRGSGAQLEN